MPYLYVVLLSFKEKFYYNFVGACPPENGQDPGACV